MEPAAPLSTELVYLAWSVVLLLAYIIVQAQTATMELGLPYNAGARDEGRTANSALAQRSARALRNFLETFPAFVALALALAVTGRVGGIGAIGAALWFWARIVYLPVYLLGIPYVRTVVWAVAAVGLVLMLVRLLS